MLINSSQPQPQPPYVSLLVYQSTLTFANPRETISKKNPSTSTTRDPRKNISPPHHFFKLFLKKAERFTNVWWARSLSIYYIMTCKDNNKVPCGGRYRTMTRSEHTHPRLILVMLLSVCLFSFGISSHCQAFTTTTTTTTIAFSNIIRRRNAVSVSVSSSSCLSMIASSSTKVAAGLLQELPERGPDGVYHILTPDQHKALLTAYPDHLVILKVFAPWCRACKGLEPKFKALVADNKYAKLPMIWADLTIQHNKDFVKTIGVLALPTIQFYVHGQRLDTFPCGPSKVPILKQKLTQLVTDYIDASTLQLKPKSDTADVAGADGQVVESMDASASETSTRPASTTTPSTTTTAKMDLNSAATRAVPTTTTSSSPFDKDRILQQVKSKVRSIPYFRGMLESEFESLLDKTQILTFEAFSVIMKQGNPGRTFYYIVEGEVEICQRTSLEDPLATPPQYLGTVINRFEAGDYFGERALITGEPRAASIRASRPTTCLAFDREDFEASCVLSGKSTLLMAGGDNTNNDLMNMDDRYGVAWNTMDQNIMKAWNDAQYQQAVQASQTRGSVNRPREIDGVDNDLEVKEDDDDMTYYASPSSSSSSSSSSVASSSDTTNTIVGADPEIIVPLLLRFKLIRLVTRCFDYIVENRLRLGDEASQKRRMLLVNLLSIGQQAEIRDAFSLLDNDGDGEVTLDELKRCMQSVGDVRSEEELVDFIDASHVLDDGKQVLTYRDFFGIMAEVEFYNLFLETFAALDHRNSGFVRAKDLDRVLCGIRDLVTGDRFSIIDVEDTDMMVDYEQFSKMLLGGESLRT